MLITGDTGVTWSDFEARGSTRGKHSQNQFADGHDSCTSCTGALPSVDRSASVALMAERWCDINNNDNDNCNCLWGITLDQYMLLTSALSRVCNTYDSMW